MLESELTTALTEMTVEESNKQPTNKFFYKRIAKHYVSDDVKKDNKEAVLTSAAYHKKIKILITGIFCYIYLSVLISCNKIINQDISK